MVPQEGGNNAKVQLLYLNQARAKQKAKSQISRPGTFSVRAGRAYLQRYSTKSHHYSTKVASRLDYSGSFGSLSWMDARQYLLTYINTSILLTQGKVGRYPRSVRSMSCKASTMDPLSYRPQVTYSALSAME